MGGFFYPSWEISNYILGKQLVWLLNEKSDDYSGRVVYRRTLGFLLRFHDTLCWNLMVHAFVWNFILFDEEISYSRERLLKNRCRTAAFCCVSTPCYTIQHHGVISQLYCACLLRPTELTALFVPIYTMLSSVFDYVSGYTSELNKFQPVVLCGVFCFSFTLIFGETSLANID